MSAVTSEQLEMWKAYGKTRDPDIRKQLILDYSYIVKYVAGRLSICFGSNVDYDDLVGFGVFGLIDAIDKFDYKKGVKFETYASLRIRGSILDSVRELDWVPRSLRQKSKELEKVYWELENELGHSVSDQEVAKKLGISMEEFHKLLNEVNISSMASLDEFIDQSFEIKADSSNSNREERPEGYVELIEIRDILTDAINRLPENERNVVSLYYFEELTLREISVIMNVSESRISQLHTKAILKLRGKLSRHRSALSGC